MHDLSINNCSFYTPLNWKSKRPLKLLHPLFISIYYILSVTDGTLSTKLYDKRDDINFHILKFPYICSNIPEYSAYGVHISQLIRYTRVSSSYGDFIDRGRLLTNKRLMGLMRSHESNG